MFGNIIFPMTGFLDIALSCASVLLHSEQNISVENFVIREPFVLEDASSHKTYILQVLASPSESGSGFEIEIYSRPSTEQDVSKNQDFVRERKKVQKLANFELYKL